MDKPFLNSEIWNLPLKACLLLLGALLTGVRWFLSDIRQIQKDQGAKIEEFGKEMTDLKLSVEKEFSDLRVVMAELGGRLDAISDIKEYLHTLKNNSAFAQHIKKKTKQHNKRLNRLQKKIV